MRFFCGFLVELHPYLPQNKLVEFCKQKGVNIIGEMLYVLSRHILAESQTNGISTSFL